MKGEVSVFKRTNDKWYPNFKLSASFAGDVDDQGELVEVCFLRLRDYKTNSKPWRVCVWGADDIGMEKDFSSKSKAWSAFLEIIKWEEVSISRLREELGFYGA